MEIIFEPHKCIHHGQCVGNLPTVFKIEGGQLLIDKKAAAEDKIREVVNDCPSGALSIPA